MVKVQNEILEQILAAIDAMREQLDILETKVASLQTEQQFEPETLVVEDQLLETEQQEADKTPVEESPADIPVLEQQEEVVEVEEPVSEDAPLEMPAEVESEESVMTDSPEEDLAPELQGDLVSETEDIPGTEPEVELVSEPDPTPEVEDIPQTPVVEDAPQGESAPELEDMPEETPEMMDLSEEPFDITLTDVDIDITSITDDLGGVDIEPEIAPDAVSIEDIPVEEPVSEVMPVEEVAAAAPELVTEPEPIVETAPEPAPVQSPLLIDDEVSILSEAEPAAPASINDMGKPKKAVMDVFSEKLRWKTDMPGTPVKNIVSAISLNDRALFINTLFHQNPLLFTNVISSLNIMGSFDEALAYLANEFPDWNMKSDSVYRFMMAVRRKLK